jgi:DNA-binding protein
MKQTLLAILLASTLPAFAQSAVSAPAAPVIPTMVTVSPNATASLAVATTNRIFIDQSGDNPNVNMTQNGSGNKAGSAVRPVYLRGIDQKIVTNQVGATNEINLEVVNATTGPGVGATVTIQQLGNTNKADVACGYGTASDGTTALSGCKAADLNFKFSGNSNEIQYRATGEDIKAAIDVAGNTNKFFMDVVGNKHTETIKVVGDTNTFNINQRSTGAAGSSIWVDLAGNSNSFTLSQTGTIDNVINIKSVSNSGTFNITQKN